MMKKLIISVGEVDLDFLAVLDDIFPIHFLELFLPGREHHKNLTCLCGFSYPVLKVYNNTKTDSINEIPLFFHESVIN